MAFVYLYLLWWLCYRCISVQSLHQALGREPRGNKNCLPPSRYNTWQV